MTEKIQWITKKVKVSDLKEWPKNPRKITTEKLNHLISSIKKFGSVEPPIVNLDMVLCGGHGRKKAYQKIGIKEVDCIFPSRQLTEEEFGELNVRLNKNIAGEWDMDVLLKEFQVNDLVEWGFDYTELELPEAEIIEGQTDEDETPELPKYTVVKRGDIWLLGNHRVMCGDSTMIDDVERLMNSEKADMVFTSPPYADMRDYNGGKELNEEHLSDFVNNFIADYFVINLGLKRKDNEIVPYWDIYLNKCKESGLKLLSWNIWDKGEAGSFANQQAMFPIEHEWLFVFGEKREDIKKTEKTKHGGQKITMTVRERDGSLTPRKGGTVGTFKHHGTIFRQTTLKGKREFDHPAAFPVFLPEKHIEIFDAKIVADPFLGSGTTLIACEKTNRKCFGMELDEHYCDVIINRWQNFTGKKAILESNKKTYDELKTK